MKRMILAAALAVAACSPSGGSTATSTAAAAPQSLMQQAQAKPLEEQPVFAWQLLTQYQAKHPEATPACPRVRRAEPRGVIPADVTPGSVYAPYVGALVYSVQCGQQLTTVASQPNEHWLVILPPNATDPTVITCADAHGSDICVRPVPRGAPAAP